MVTTGDNDMSLTKAFATTVIQIRYPVAFFWYFPIIQYVGSIPLPYKVKQTPIQTILGLHPI